MGWKLEISILVFFVSLALTRCGFGQDKSSQTLLREGLVLRGVDGRLTKPDDNEAPDRWFFEFDSDVNDSRAVVKAGTGLELLPSAALQRMLADVNERAAASYRLWCRVTKYRNRNFIFPIYFLPLSKIKPPSTQPSQPPQPDINIAETESTINEPNDILSIPKEVIEKLRARRIQMPKPVEKQDQPLRPEIKEQSFQQDFVLVDRSAFLVVQDDGRLVIVLDALGRNVPKVSFQPLPCEVLQQAEEAQAAEPDPLRFKIAGLVTKYKGKQYLLLQKATRIYHHGNFVR